MEGYPQEDFPTYAFSFETVFADPRTWPERTSPGHTKCWSSFAQYRDMGLKTFWNWHPYEVWRAMADEVDEDLLNGFYAELRAFNDSLRFHTIYMDISNEGPFTSGPDMLLEVSGKDGGYLYENVSRGAKLRYSRELMDDAYGACRRDDRRCMAAVAKEADEVRRWLDTVPGQYGFYLYMPRAADAAGSFRAMSFGRRPRASRGC